MKRKMVMVPGPIEFSPEVLNAMAVPTANHVSGEFIECFGESLEMLKDVFVAPDYSPFIIAGSGTLAMDISVCNIIEPGDRVLVVDSGYFSQRMADIIRWYGGQVDLLQDKVGDIPCPEDVEKALEKGIYRAVTITHVDTSTSVLADIKNITRVAKKAGCLVIVDGVAGAAGARCQTSEWGIDIYFTASQKAVGAPPGLALLVVSPEAMDVFHNRKTPVMNYYASFQNWLPIMEAYQNRGPAYFGTPAVNNVRALNVALKQIIEEGLEKRFTRHEKIAGAFREGIRAMGLQIVPVKEEKAAPTLTAIYYPNSEGKNLVKYMEEEGIVVAGGLHPEIKDKYFRIGHMGSCCGQDIILVISALESCLKKLDSRYEIGKGLTACRQKLYEINNQVKGKEGPDEQ